MLLKTGEQISTKGDSKKYICLFNDEPLEESDAFFWEWGQDKYHLKVSNEMLWEICAYPIDKIFEKQILRITSFIDLDEEDLLYVDIGINEKQLELALEFNMVGWNKHWSIDEFFHVFFEKVEELFAYLPSPVFVEVESPFDNKIILPISEPIIIETLNAAVESLYDIFYEVVDFFETRNSIVKCIEFPPEYKQAGLSILNYFGRIVEQKYPDVSVKLRIEQERNIVRLVIETPEGEKEKIEQALEDYALVVKGHLSPELLLSDKIQILELKNQLDIAKVQIKTSERLLSFSEQQNKSLEKRVEELTSIVHSTLSRNQDLTGILELSLQRRDLDDEVRQAIKSIQEKVKQEMTEEDRDHILEELKIIRNNSRGVFQKIQEFGFASASGTTGAVLAEIIRRLGF